MKTGSSLLDKAASRKRLDPRNDLPPVCPKWVPGAEKNLASSQDPAGVCSYEVWGSWLKFYHEVKGDLSQSLETIKYNDCYHLVIEHSHGTDGP